FRSTFEWAPVAAACSGRARILPASSRTASSDMSGKRGGPRRRRHRGRTLRTNLLSEQAKIEVLGPAAPIEVVDHHGHRAVSAADRLRRGRKDYANHRNECPDELQRAGRHSCDQTGGEKDSESA